MPSSTDHQGPRKFLHGFAGSLEFTGAHHRAQIMPHHTEVVGNTRKQLEQAGNERYVKAGTHFAVDPLPLG